MWLRSCRLQTCIWTESVKYVSWGNVSNVDVHNAQYNNYALMRKLHCDIVYDYDTTYVVIHIHRFGYPHYLHVKVFPNVKYIWGDVICLYWPWALKKSAAENTLKALPCLSIMHGKAHSWHCQVHKILQYMVIIALIRFFGVEDGRKEQHLVLVKIWSSYFHISHDSITQLNA